MNATAAETERPPRMRLPELAKTLVLSVVGIAILVSVALEQFTPAKRWLDRTGG